MMKRILLAATLLVCVLVLFGCSSGDSDATRYDVVTQSEARATQNIFGGDTAYSVTAAPYVAPVEQDTSWYYESATTPAPTMISEYAGATPVVIDPIDKPTPTPLPELSISYETYDATNIHLSFEGPQGWLIDESSSDTYTLTNPDTRADFLAMLSVTVTNVGSNYSKTEIQSAVTSTISALRPAYYTFSSTKPAARTLLDKDGYYEDFTATLSNGTAVKGRVQITCVDKKLYILQMTVPAGYFEAYKDTLYARFRKTVRITQ